MNILFLADIVPYPPNTGIKIRTYNIIKELHAGGENRVFLFCFNHRKLIPTEEELQRCIAALEEHCAEVHVFDIPSDANRWTYAACLAKNVFQRVPYRVERYRSEQCRAEITRCMARNRIDLVHLDKTELYGYADLMRGLPIVCTNHNVESSLMKRRVRYETSKLRSLYAYLQYVKTKAYEQDVLRKVRAFITCTELDLSFFRKEFGIDTQAAVIDNGVDVHKYSPSTIFGGDYILIIGAQNRETTANFDATHYFMRDIWPQVLASCPNIKLKIAGRHPDPSIVQYASQYPGAVEVLGFVEDERSLLAGAAALVVPLRVGGGSRLKIVTALAAGKAIVSTSIGAEGIAYTDGVDILIADDAARFAERVCEVFGSAALQQRIGANGRRLAEERYDWQKIGARARDFYEQLLASPSR